MMRDYQEEHQRILQLHPEYYKEQYQRFLELHPEGSYKYNKGLYGDDYNRKHYKRRLELHPGYGKIKIKRQLELHPDLYKEVYKRRIELHPNNNKEKYEKYCKGNVKVIEYMKKYREENKEHISECKKQWRIKNMLNLEDR